MGVQLCGLILSALLLAVEGARASNMPNKEEFLAAYEPAVTKLIDFYGKLEITATCRRINWASYADSGGRRTLKLVFRANGNRYRIDETQAEQNADTAAQPARVRVVSPKRCFSAERKSPTGDYVLTLLSTNYVQRLEAIRASCYLVAAPYGFLETTVPDFLRQAEVEITGVEQFQQAGEQLTRVCFAFHLDGRTRHGFFLFSSNRAWALRGYYYGWEPWTDSGDIKGLRAKIEYKGEHEGIPLLARAEYWLDDSTTGERKNIEIFEIEEIRIGPVPEGEFTLAAVGIPDTSAHSRVRPALWCVLTALGLLFGALLVAKLAKRRDIDTRSDQVQ